VVSNIPKPIKQLILKPRFLRRIYGLYRHYRTDCYVISYPKCGRTWLRAMIAKVLALYFGDPRDIVFDPEIVIRTGHHNGPIIQFVHNGSLRPLTTGAKPLEDHYQRYSRKKVIFLVRDPRDVLVSYYFHRTRRRGESHNLSGFVRHPWWGIDRIIAFMKGWYEHRHVPSDFLLVRYEDLHQDAAAELQRILAFIELRNVSDELIKRAVDYASFDHMRRMQLNELSDRPELAPADPRDAESFKVRKGKVGGYVTYLSLSDIEYIESIMCRQLPASFGYLPSRAQ
jgi:hypothetical protein